METSSYEAMCRVIEKFRWALVSLGHVPTSGQLEKWSMYVLEGMSGPARFYHSPDHVLELSEKMDPIATLAALFHDIVYYQVDGGVAPFIHSQIYNYFNSVNGILYIKELEPPDLIYEVTLEVFGYSPGQQLLANNGQNEFLSTLFALRVLSDIVSNRELMEIAVCIEATIPFRANTNAMKELKTRIISANKRFHLGIGKSDIEKIMTRAVLLSNKDVENFSYADTGLFLDQTWRLLPETNARLSTSSTYSVKEYRIALFKMEGFLSFLKADAIYHQYNGIPGPEEHRESLTRAENNIKISVFYLRLKLYSTALLEALAKATGGDAPLVYFTGNIGKQGATGKSVRMDQFLSDFIPSVQSTDHDPVVERILSASVSRSVEYDTRSSPLSSYLYKHLGEKNILEGYRLAKEMFIGNISCEDFLKAQNPVLTEEIITACSVLALTRKKRLVSLLDLYGISDASKKMRDAG